MKLWYINAKLKLCLLKLITFFIPNKTLRKKIVSNYTDKEPLLNNEFVIIRKNGKAEKFPFTKNIKVEFKGHNNKLIVYEPQKDLKNLKVSFWGNNSVAQIKKSKMPMHNLTIYKIGNNSTVKIGKNFSCRTCIISFAGENNLKVKIGNDCMFANTVRIQPTDSHTLLDWKTNECINKGKDIIIEDNVWALRDTVFQKGARVPKNSVVATRAVVTKSFEQNKEEEEQNGGVILAGIPAKIIRTGIKWTAQPPRNYIE